jgi:hypothetical protein
MNLCELANVCSADDAGRLAAIFVCVFIIILAGVQK